MHDLKDHLTLVILKRILESLNFHLLFNNPLYSIQLAIFILLISLLLFLSFLKLEYTLI